MSKATVRARIHYGTKSLDVTIPSAIAQEHGIKGGDVFSVVADLNSQGQTEITYTRVFQQIRD